MLIRNERVRDKKYAGFESRTKNVECSKRGEERKQRGGDEEIIVQINRNLMAKGEIKD